MALQNRTYWPVETTYAWQRVLRSPITGRKDVLVKLFCRVQDISASVTLSDSQSINATLSQSVYWLAQSRRWLGQLQKWRGGGNISNGSSMQSHKNSCYLFYSIGQENWKSALDTESY